MDYGITLSIRQFLATYMPEVTQVVLMRDGVTLTGRTKPFITVKYLGTEDEPMSAGRQSYETIIRYQIGIHAEDVSQMLKLASKTKTLTRRSDGIVRYDDSAVATEDRFYVDVSGFTPIDNDSTSEDTDNHRGYFDASVTIYYDNGATEFSQ